MFSTLLLEITGNLATITLNRPEKRNAISTQMMAELQTALDEIEKTHARVGIVTGAETIASGKSGGLPANCETVPQDLEFSEAAHRGSEWGGLRRWLRNCDTVRFYAGRAGSEIRVHGSKDRFSASNSLRIFDAADWRKTLPRFIADWPHHRGR